MFFFLQADSMSTPIKPEVYAAFEFGYRACEKGWNLQKADAEFKKLYASPEPPKDEATLAADVFNPNESDLQYAQRRVLELKVKPLAKAVVETFKAKTFLGLKLGEVCTCVERKSGRVLEAKVIDIGKDHCRLKGTKDGSLMDLNMRSDTINFE